MNLPKPPCGWIVLDGYAFQVAHVFALAPCNAGRGTEIYSSGGDEPAIVLNLPIAEVAKAMWHFLP